MRRERNVKIVATLGPASGDKEKIAQLFEAGADLFRLNFSHGSHADHQARIDAIRAIEKDTGHPIGVLMDLQGPKFRVGEFEGGEVELTAGEKFRLDLTDRAGDAERAPLPHPEVFAALAEDTVILLDDGKIRLQVQKCDGKSADTIVLTGGTLSDNKGVNLPGTVVPVSPLTDKDREDLRFGLDAGVDWVALSFVQRPEDVAEARKLVDGRASLMSKIEKPAGIDRLAGIIEQSDAVMVARGDLGVEMPPEDVPILQRSIVRAARQAGKPVVVATQMLESMIKAPTPTRAEASDVATAVYEGADAVMLSAETAAGEYPCEAVAMMERIIRRVEQDPMFRRIMDAEHPDPESTEADAITEAARSAARTVGAAAIVTYTTTGSTTLRASRERPDVPVLALTPVPATARRLVLAWGVHCVTSHDAKDVEDMVDIACRLALRDGLAKSGERIIITAGMPFGTPGATNLLRIAWV